MLRDEILRGLSRTAIADAFLLRGPERAATSYPASLHASMLELYLAAGTRARAADVLAEESTPSALTLYREAALLYMAAFVTVRSGVAITEPLDAADLVSQFQALPPSPLPCAPAEFERFLSQLGNADILAVDRLDAPAASARAQVARAVVAWLRRLIEPRTVAEIRFTRSARIGTLALVAAVALGALVWPIFAPENIALNKPVSVSGVQPGSTSPPSGLTDGVTSGSYGVHTTFSDNPWVQVDLGAVYAVGSVKIYNRGDDAFDAGLPMTLQLSENGRDFVDIETRKTTFSQKAPWKANTGHRLARYIRIRGTRGKYVSLRQLEAFGEKK
jgi:uncharacterized membrane protein